ncbi:MAG: HD-GYP domain-containing protein [Burkholderiaceae bacterium]|nr:HD-GYP domain-containing protein [Burkholderiaceae bacterium]ODS94353.1 MAG: hypothetical protein ABS56_17880 [Lautropia sp. SCN 69-89]
MLAAPSPPSPARIRLSVDDLDYGLFVAELDRPWLDTPFLLEGLNIRDEAELRTLRQYCRFVHVDLERSTGATADALRSALARHAGKPTAARALPAPAHAIEARDRNPAAPGKPFDRMRSRDSRRGVAHDGVRAQSPASCAALGLPAGTTLSPYAAPVAIEAELPRASQSWSRGAETLRALMDDLHKQAYTELRNLDEVAEGLVDSMIETPDAMLWVARLRNRDRGTYLHSMKVAVHLIALGRHIGFPREDLGRLGQIGMLADVGKMLVPGALLEKPGVLTSSEYAALKRHVQFGIEALRKSMVLDPMVEQGILQHHERLDGSGYPQRLEANEISVFGRMAAIADCFAAMTSDRPYAKAISPQEALMQIYQWGGTSFHAPLVEQFVQAIGVFPVGSLVELSNGEAAIVLAHNLVRRLEPRVLVLARADHKPLDKPFERDLLNGPEDGTRHAIRIARGLPAGAYGLRLHDYYADEDASSEGGILAPA